MLNPHRCVGAALDGIEKSNTPRIRDEWPRKDRRHPSGMRDPVYDGRDRSCGYGQRTRGLRLADRCERFRHALCGNLRSLA